VNKLELKLELELINRRVNYCHENVFRPYLSVFGKTYNIL